MQTVKPANDKNMSPAEINNIGVQLMRQQPMQEFIVGTYNFTANQTQQIKLPNFGILAGILLKVTASFSGVTGGIKPTAHVANLFKEVNFKFADGTTRHQGSSGYHINQIVERYDAFKSYVNVTTQGSPADTTNKFVLDFVAHIAEVEGVFYVPVEIPAGAMFEGAFNLTDAARGNADNFIKLTTVNLPDLITAAGNVKVASCFVQDTNPNIDSLEVEVTMLYREPPQVLPIIALNTVYSIDTFDHASPKQNGTERFELDSSGYAYLQVVQQLTDGGTIPQVDVAADTPKFKQVQLVLDVNRTRYTRRYRNQRIHQRPLSPYAPLDCIIHDWRDFPLTSLSNGALVIVNEMDASAYTAPLLTTTYERVRRGAA